jgi:hypothetical protein
MSYKHGNCFHLAGLLETCTVWYDSEAVSNWSRKIVCKEVGQARIVCMRYWELEKDDKL